MKRIREIIWPWNTSSSLNQGFDAELTIPRPREQAEIISIGLYSGELRVCIEEHISDRIGQNRTLIGYTPSKAGRFEIPDTATFLAFVPLGQYGAMHVFELDRPRTPKTDPLYRAPSLSLHDPEPAPYSLYHRAWAAREALRIRHINAAIDGARCETDSLLEAIRSERVEKAKVGGFT